jgi:hypothetical protein
VGRGSIRPEGGGPDESGRPPVPRCGVCAESGPPPDRELEKPPCRDRGAGDPGPGREPAGAGELGWPPAAGTPAGADPEMTLATGAATGLLPGASNCEGAA